MSKNSIAGALGRLGDRLGLPALREVRRDQNRDWIVRIEGTSTRDAFDPWS